jgi:hypothetical protein
VEEQRTNLVTYSEDFANAAWTKVGSTISTDTTTAPTGTTVADSLIENTSTGQHRIFRTVSGTTNTNPHTVSLFAKANTRTRIYIAIVEAPTFVRQGNAIFDLSAGTVVSASGGGNGATGGSATIQNVGNGWYRCTYTLTLGGTDTNIFLDINLVSTGTTISYTGDGYSGIYIWGAQLEAGAFPTSFIPTVAATVTRNADAASMTGTNFSSWYRADEGSVYGEYVVPFDSSTSLFPLVAAISDGTFNNSINMYERTVDDTRRISVRVNGVQQYEAGNGGTYTYGISTKHSISYKVNDLSLSVNGTAPSTSASSLIPVVNRLAIGSTDAIGGSLSYLNGTIKKLAFYPSRLANAQLQALTTV